MRGEQLGTRIAIFGVPGSGKTMLGLLLGRKLGVPVFHLDRLTYTTGWRPVPEEVWQRSLKDITSGTGWIIEGEYLEEPLPWLESVDTVIVLELSKYICLLRTVKRLITERRKERPDVPPGCEDRMNADFIRGLARVWRYAGRQENSRAAWFAGLADTKRVVVIRSAPELNVFERQLSK